MNPQTVRKFNAFTAVFCALGAVADLSLGCWRIATFSAVFAVINAVCSRAPHGARGLKHP